MFAWLFMRLSGVVLVVLIFVHLWTSLIAGDGIEGVDFGFVAGKWADPLWQVWDLVMLWLAMLHGTNGVRVIINDYAEKDSTRFWLKNVLYVSTVVIVVLGTLVIFTFDPCPVVNGVPHVCRSISPTSLLWAQVAPACAPRLNPASAQGRLY